MNMKKNPSKFQAAVVQALKTVGSSKDQVSELILITLRILNRQVKSTTNDYFKLRSMCNFTFFQSTIFRINVSNKCIIGYEDFYIPEINDLISLERDYELWYLLESILSKF